MFFSCACDFHCLRGWAVLSLSFSVVFLLRRIGVGHYRLSGAQAPLLREGKTSKRRVLGDGCCQQGAGGAARGLGGRGSSRSFVVWGNCSAVWLTRPKGFKRCGRDHETLRVIDRYYRALLVANALYVRDVDGMANNLTVVGVSAHP